MIMLRGVSGSSRPPPPQVDHSVLAIGASEKAGKGVAVAPDKGSVGYPGRAS